MSICQTGHLSLMKLHTADHLLFLRANQLLRQHGITIQQALVLQYLASNTDSSINQKKIETYLGISNPSVTSLMKGMVAKNLIQRFPDRTDTRSHLLRLTPLGHQLQTSIAEAFLRLHNELHAGLTAKESQQLHTLLDKITANLTSLSE